jgi:UDP-N-acetylmuramate--alanine ligase
LVKSSPDRGRAPALETLDPGRPIHLAGVAGTAMSGLARLLRQQGFPVVGTDPRPDEQARDRLAAAGVAIFDKQDGSHIRSDTQLLVASAALGSDHAELRAASRLGIPVVKYAEMLGAIFNRTEGIAVAGTHGKTTTTAMIVCSLKKLGADPGYIVGGFVPQLDASADAGRSRLFVAEACEYDRSFLNLSPRRAVITNVGADHLDVYGDLQGVAAAFKRFAARIDPGGAVVYPADDEHACAAVAEAGCRKISFSTRGRADFRASGIRCDGERTVFEVAVDDRSATAAVRLPGRHNVANALAALAICADTGYPLEALIDGLDSFRGVARRFEVKGEAAGVTVVDDYAHHPTEVRALLDGAAARFAGQRLVTVFQPHQITRTRLLASELAVAFEKTDVLIVTDIYAARDSLADPAESSSAGLVEQISRSGTQVRHVAEIPQAVNHLLEMLRPGDVLLTVGAGDIHRVADAVLRALVDVR